MPGRKGLRSTGRRNNWNRVRRRQTRSRWRAAGRSRKLKKMMKYRQKVTTFPGRKAKLNNRPELKFTFYRSVANYNPNAVTWTKIYGTSGNDPSGVAMTTWPQVGAYSDQRVGNRINSVGFEVRFLMNVYTPNALIAQIQDWWRLSVVRPRMDNISENNVNDLPDDINTSWDSKKWKVWYDKIMPICTGTPVAFTGQVVGQLMSKPKSFRFFIPWKQTIQYGGNGLVVVNPLIDECPIIMIYSVYGTIQVKFPLVAKFYYRDP